MASVWPSATRRSACAPCGSRARHRLNCSRDFRRSLRARSEYRHVSPRLRRWLPSASSTARCSTDGTMARTTNRELRAKAVRPTLGEDALITANANDRRTQKTAPLLNGSFMECWRSMAPEEWNQSGETLRWAAAYLPRPRIDCVETWFHKSRADPIRLGSAKTAALTSPTAAGGVTSRTASWSTFPPGSRRSSFRRRSTSGVSDEARYRLPILLLPAMGTFCRNPA
jgi:hypothetical protein